MIRRLLPAVAVTLLLATPFRGVAAQSFPTDDPVLKRIWAIGMDSSHTMELAARAARLDRPAPHRLARTEERAGLAREDVRELGDRREERALRHLARLASRLVAHRPREPARAHARGDDARLQPGHRRQGRHRRARSCCRASPTAPSSCSWLPQAKGKLVLVSAPQPTCRPTDDWTEFATPASHARMDSAARAGDAASGASRTCAARATTSRSPAASSASGSTKPASPA